MVARAHPFQAIANAFLNNMRWDQRWSHETIIPAFTSTVFSLRLGAFYTHAHNIAMHTMSGRVVFDILLMLKSIFLLRDSTCTQRQIGEWKRVLLYHSTR